MKKILIAGMSIVFVGLGATSAQADNASKKEMAGVGAGAAIGGAIAGPPGIVVGAALGALVGDRSHNKDVTLDELNSTVAHKSAEVSRLNGALRDEQRNTAELVAELEMLDDSDVRELHGFLQQGIEIDMPFRTDDIVVDNNWQSRLVSLATVVQETNGLAIQIDGYADPRGSVEYNAALSLQRAEAVRKVLSNAGVAAERMTTFGHGESLQETTVVTDPDLLALQRKVTITIYRDENGADFAQLTD